MDTRVEFEEIVKDGVRYLSKKRSTVDGDTTVYCHVYDPLPVDDVEEDVRLLGRKHLMMMQEQWRRQDVGAEQKQPDAEELARLVWANFDSVYENCIMGDSRRSVLAEAYGKEHVRALYLEGAFRN